VCFLRKLGTDSARRQKLVVKHLNPVLEIGHAAAVCKLLDKFRREQERDSNHGRYFEAGNVAAGRMARLFVSGDAGDADEVQDGVQFMALPYITYGQPPPGINELRRALHPTRSLFQHYYRRESTKAIEGRDAEQICRKARGAGGNDKGILVEYVWILRLDEGW
jgi:hypothetical protein